MKTALFALTAIVSIQTASAANLTEAYTLKILPQSKVTSVHCEKPRNLDHDTAQAGTILVTANDGEKVTMNLVISRFSDVDQEARALCRLLKKAKALGKALEVIYDERTDWEEKTQYDIKGVTKLFGLSFEG